MQAEEGTAFLLEQSLARMLIGMNVEVINRSVGGMSFHHYALMTEKLVGEIAPDLVVYFVCGNDSEMHYLPLGLSADAAAELQWGEQSPLVAHLRASAKRSADVLKRTKTPGILFGINYLDVPGAAEMDRVLRGLAEETGMRYATTRGRLDTLPHERLVATDSDHHPSGYVHQVAVNEICLVLTRDLRVHEKSREIGVGELLKRLVDRLVMLPMQAGGFQMELLRVIDLLTQKGNHLRKSPRATSFDREIGELSAARAGLLACLDRYSDTLGGIARLRHQELNMLALDEWPLEMFQRVKLLNAQVHDTLSLHLERDAKLPWVDAGEEPKAGMETQLLAQVEAATAQVANIADSLRELTAPSEAGPAITSLPGEIRQSVERVWSHIVNGGRDALVRAEIRQEKVIAVLREAAEYGADLLKRARQAISAGGLRRRAAVRSLSQYMGMLGNFQGSYFNLPQTHIADHKFWSPQEWEGIEHAPRWTVDVEMTTDSSTAVGLWVDAVTPAAFYADYQQTSVGPGKYRFTFPHVREFHLKRCASATSFNVNGEPIVRTPAEAYRCFRLTDIDVLVLGPFLVERLW